MPPKDFLLLENIEPKTIAYHPTKLNQEGTTNPIELGPLFDLFFRSAVKTYRAETGDTTGPDDNHKKWLGPSRFHLPPNIRWICEIHQSKHALDFSNPVMWMAAGPKVLLAEFDPIKLWNGGLFAQIELPLKVTIQEAWSRLSKLLDEYDLQPIDDTVLLENMQAFSHGGWDRYRIMVEIDEMVMDEKGFRIL